jgi:inhibitor of cysteine peptidase
MNKKIVYLSAIFFFGLFFSSCSLTKETTKLSDNKALVTAVNEVQNNEPDLVYSGQMKKFNNYDELASFLKEKTFVLLDYHRSLESDKLVEDSSMDAGTSYSIDNGQNLDINRADILKTEGEYIYAISYKDLFVIKASEDSIQVLAKLTFYSRPSEIYVSEGKLIVIGLDTEIMDAQVYKNFRRQSPYTFVKVFDLQNPASPIQIRDLDFEGSYLESKLVNKQLYLILDNFDDYIIGEPVVPRLVDEGRILPFICRDNSACFAPSVYYFDAPYDSHHFISINTLDLSTAKEAVEAQSYILNSDQNIYISAQNIYLTYARGVDVAALRLEAMRSILENRLSTDELARVSKIKSFDNLILNKIEKKQKLQQVYDNFLANVGADELLVFEMELDSSMKDKLSALSTNWQETLIYKLKLGGKLPVYQAKGSVIGIVNSSLAMDEDVFGNLRLIASIDKKDPLFSGEKKTRTGFYILSPQLNLLSSIENIISNQKLGAVRFLGNRIYLSALESTNTFYVIDATQVKAPKLLGQLKLSDPLAYLYPYDENTLINLGRDVQIDVYGNEKLGGIKLSLLDVSDISHPLELDSYSAGSIASNSLTLLDHQDFMFRANKNILAVPASLTANGSLSNYFDGVLFFNIESGKLVLRDKVDHSDGGKYQLIDPNCVGICYNSSVKRIVDINGLLYTFSNKYIKVNNSSDFSLRQILKLIPDSEVDTAFIGVAEPNNDVQLENKNAAAEFNPTTDEMTPIGPSLFQGDVLSENGNTASSSDLILDELPPADDNINIIDTTDVPASIGDETDTVSTTTPENDGIDLQILP